LLGFGLFLKSQVTSIFVPKQQLPTATGVVTEALPNTMFRVLLDGEDRVVLTYLAGKMRKFRIRVGVGDKVELVLDQEGGERGRIHRRNR
jgi:translation initiation factor IF-1